ncbi:MAG: PD-(D/E)XK nuclease family protein [bacterium]|nr:PD-(D/E)XK nuclease family protein [bacterium]
MNKYYKKEKGLYNSNSKELFAISRSKIDLFLGCPRCFYLDRKLGLGRPSLPGWALNSAVDKLLKNEFDLLRKKGESHKLMIAYGIDAIPFDHPDLKIWRDDVYQYVGACAIHQKTNLKVCGIIDDVWINEKTKELFLADYKATSTSKEISLEDEYKQSYKKQMEIYQWIFRQMGFKVSNTGYFLFANAGKNRPEFDARLEFETSIIPYQGDDSWVEPALFEIKKCLESDIMPKASEECEYCAYRGLIGKEEPK